MNDRTYFVVAVTIALIVPMIFGGFYFMRVMGIKENAHYVTLLKDSPDLVIIGDTAIESELKSKKQQVASFSVQYARGETGNLKYRLVLDRFDELGDTDIIWELFMLDNKSDDYVSYTSGTLNKNSSKKIELNSFKTINPLETQKFKLYYYLNGEKEIIGKLKSNIILEQE